MPVKKKKNTEIMEYSSHKTKAALWLRFLKVKIRGRISFVKKGMRTWQWTNDNYLLSQKTPKSIVFLYLLRVRFEFLRRSLNGIDTLLREKTLTKLLLLPSEKGSTLLKFFPFSVDLFSKGPVSLSQDWFDPIWSFTAHSTLLRSCWASQVINSNSYFSCAGLIF